MRYTIRKGGASSLLRTLINVLLLRIVYRDSGQDVEAEGQRFIHSDKSIATNQSDDVFADQTRKSEIINSVKT